MANWESYHISDIISEIEGGKYVLPVIQRRLVWEEDKMELLFDTLLKGDSFGGIMVLKEEQGYKPLFNFRHFTKNGEIEKSHDAGILQQTQSFVIDGQQRLQSFYIGLTGSINGKILYFDLFSNYKTEFEFKFESNFEKLPTKAKDDSEKIIKEYKWISASALLKKLKLANNNDRQVSRSIIAGDGIKDEQQKTHVEENVGAFSTNIIAGKCLGVSEVGVDKTETDELTNRQKIVELFRRLNDGGTQLSSFDLVASILKGFDWKMEEFLDKTLEDFLDIGLNQDNLIKLIFILQDNHKKEMSEIEAADADFAIKNKERIKATLKALKDFLIYSKLNHYYREKNRSFIPLFFISYHLFHKSIGDTELTKYFDNYDTGNSEYPKIKKWLYNSLINGVFRSKGAGWIPYKTGIKKMLEEIKEHKNRDFPVARLFNVYKDHPITFTEVYESDNLDNLDSSFVYYLMYDQGQTIRIQDIDHIMPKSRLEAKGVAPEKINSIKNFQLIDYGTNRGDKNGKEFALWINDSDYVTDKSAFVKRHLIPPSEELWSEDKFEDFLEARAGLIIAQIANYVA
ncbi:MAG: DUF262 domain-containing protein [Cyclobacteriaceae bacterium]